MKIALGIALSSVIGLSTTAYAAEIRVPEDKPTIQACIDSAVAGDTCSVAPGHYTENAGHLVRGVGVHVRVSKPVTIVARELYQSTLDGLGSSGAFFGVDASAEIRGFVIQNVRFGIIQLNAVNANWNVRNVIVRNVSYGIAVDTPDAHQGFARVANVVVDSCSGVAFYTNDADGMEVRNSIASNCNVGFQGHEHNSFTVSYSLLHELAVARQPVVRAQDLPVFVASVLKADPQFVTAVVNGRTFPYFLRCASPAIDTGDPADFDASIPFGLGTNRSDIGAYGGPGAVLALSAAEKLALLTAAGCKTITTVAGNGTGGFAGNGGSATAAALDSPFGLAVDAAGNIFIADTGNHRIRKVDPQGNITTVAGNGTAINNPGSGAALGDGGQATSASLFGPESVAVDAAGNLFIADALHRRVRRVDAVTGIITTVAGNGGSGFTGDGGPATDAQINAPRGVALDATGNLFIADNQNNRIRRVEAGTGIITTVVGNGAWGFAGDGGPATAATLAEPNDVAVDAAGNLFIADMFNHRIRRVDAGTGTITTLAGGDGSLNSPNGVAVDAAGNLFIADSSNHRVVRGDAPQFVTGGTAAGMFGIRGFAGDGGPATAARARRSLRRRRRRRGERLHRRPR